MYKVKAGEQVYIFIGKERTIRTTVIGFACYGMVTNDGVFPFISKLFYGYGYFPDGRRVIVANSRWVYFWANLIESIRCFLFCLKK